MDIKAVLGDAYKEGMTVEELTTALARVELPKDQSEEINHLKEVISNKNSDYSIIKKIINFFTKNKFVLCLQFFSLLILLYSYFKCYSCFLLIKSFKLLNKDSKIELNKIFDSII